MIFFVYFFRLDSMPNIHGKSNYIPRNTKDPMIVLHFEDNLRTVARSLRPEYSTFIQLSEIWFEVSIRRISIVSLKYKAKLYVKNPKKISTAFFIWPAKGSPASCRWQKSLELKRLLFSHISTVAKSMRLYVTTLNAVRPILVPENAILGNKIED